MKHVYIYGWCHHDDLKFLDDAGKSELKFYSGPTINAYEIGMDSWYDALGAASKVDLAIFAGYGISMANYIAPIFRDPVAKQIFDAIPIKAYISFDTHWQWRAEAQYSHQFDQFYTAHAMYAPLVPGAVHLPAGFYPLSYQELVDLKPAPAGPALVFPVCSHGYGDRDALIELMAIKLNAAGVLHDFAPVYDRFGYCGKLAGAKACLNVPSLGNFNFRNFEAWALNVPLLAPKSPAYNQFPELKKKTVFFNRDLSDFDQAVERVLKVQSAGTRPYVLAKHMMMHRYLEIINRTFSTDYKLSYPA